jgi:hypothetical protein
VFAHCIVHLLMIVTGQATKMVDIASEIVAEYQYVSSE